jgi:hypothetical protein
MELVQAPHHLKSNQLVDKKHEENMKRQEMRASLKSKRISKRMQSGDAINE